jgi:IS30 family transposase
MEKSYNHLKPEERATLMLMMREGATVRSVARTLSRAPSTISRELKRNCSDGRIYEAAAAGDRAREKRYERRRW